MKMTKLMSLLLLIATMVGFTSCSDDDDNNQRTFYGIAKVVSSTTTTYFETNDGVRYIPTTKSLNSARTNGFSATSGLVYLVCVVNTDNFSNNTYTDVELSGAVSLEGTVTTKTGTEEADTAIENQLPVIELCDIGTSSATERVVFYDSSEMILGVNYFLSTTTHAVNLNFYPEQVQGNDTDLKLYLRHISTDNSLSYTSYNMQSYYPSLFYHSYNISNAVSQFESITGNKPATVTVYAYINAYETGLPTSYTPFTASYSAE